MPSASVIMTIAVTPGALVICRSAYRISSQTELILGPRKQRTCQPNLVRSGGRLSDDARPWEGGSHFRTPGGSRCRARPAYRKRMTGGSSLSEDTADIAVMSPLGVIDA